MSKMCNQNTIPEPSVSKNLQRKHFGDIAVQHAETGEPHQNRECYIDGIPFNLDEVRFGEIVRRPV